MGYFSGGQGPVDHAKEESETGEERRKRRRRNRVPEGLGGGGGPEALEIRFDPARAGPSGIDAHLAELARTCTTRDVKWWYPKGIETRIDLGEGVTLLADPMTREFGPDAEGIVQFSVEGEGKAEIRLKVSAPEGISVSPAELPVSSGAGGRARLSVKVTGKPERFARLSVEASREGADPVPFPVLLIVGGKTESEAKGTFQLHPSETDPNWSIFGSGK